MRIPSIRLALLASCAALTALSATAAPKLMQGPMLGHVDQSSAQIWARVAGEANLSILYSESPRFTDARETPPVRALAENDYCVRATIDGLEAGSFYYYQVLVDGEPLDAVREQEGYPLLTAPPSDMEVQFTIAFGAGAKSEIDGMQAIWLQVQNARPHAFFWLGDNESAEGLPPAFQAEQYRKQRNIPFLQPLLRSIPQMATWDGPKQDTAKSFDVFQRYWANPSYGTQENPGSYFKYNYGGVDFFVLDTYSFRDTQEKSTLLGNAQVEWLKAELDASAAPFKVLLSSSSWTDIKENNDSTWTAFSHERDALLSHITTNDIPGVILVSGDNDQAEVKAIPMSQKGGYDFYELVSSPLAQDPVATYDEQEASTINIHEPYATTMNFGLLSFDMTGDDPSFAYDVINVFGESVFPTLEVKASELKNGVASWQTKVDDPAAYANAAQPPVAPSEAVVQ
ncbi:alkaline phosphatase D family protein [Pelagicoccus sp. SDUM812005]|uniref:alkaline phosphatase D family protein n=1 Tax=Pelagicoccus sp. SDUM812005 TaxID=3041257 RepID=UPI00280D3D38|nr:alkaline phosphatase D family protein [Pelagicoccus sp. SDUM812005]MDQ8182112.1 alkaline phosphatase D family protein [Pelagicoccus sp. SDUM812005]